MIKSDHSFPIGTYIIFIDKTEMARSSFSRARYHLHFFCFSAGFFGISVWCCVDFTPGVISSFSAVFFRISLFIIL